jgi:hypothetical protein
MSFATIMVHVDVNPPSDARIRLAAGLAACFQATLIGACAWEPGPPLTYGGVIVDPNITEDMLQERLDQAGEHFRSLVEPDQPVEWQSAIDSPTEFVAKEARAADLLIVGRDRITGDSSRSLDPGAVVLKAGRPVLAVPPDIQSLTAELIVIGWKDNRAIAANPSEVFLIEGHTDAVGSDVDNLSLSDRRAEAVALVLSQQFGVPPENLTTRATPNSI